MPETETDQGAAAPVESFVTLLPQRFRYQDTTGRTVHLQRLDQSQTSQGGVYQV